jgi:hypothetical protein
LIAQDLLPAGFESSSTERFFAMPNQPAPHVFLRLLVLLAAIGWPAGGIAFSAQNAAAGKGGPAGRHNATQQTIAAGQGNATQRLKAARQANATGEGWVSLEPGSRPAYVGIQGGTAPVTLFRTPEGELFTYTGNTGSDFMRILRGNGSLAPTAPSKDNGERLAVGPAPAGIGQGVNPPTGEKADGPEPALQPFGLTTPEGVIVAAQEEEPTVEAPQPAPPKPRRKHKPLKLGSYLKILEGDSPS